MSILSQTTTTQKILLGLGTCILLLGTFTLGISIGERRANHMNRWAEGYRRQFEQPRGGMRAPFPFAPRMMPGGHDVFGKVMSAAGNTIIVQGKDGIEQHVIASSSTEIRIDRERGSFADIQPDKNIGVFGAPNTNGQVEAKLIRIFR